MQPGFRRRILIEPSDNDVRAELEDDYHRMAVTLRHSGGITTAVEPEMIRWPWTTCTGALVRCKETFVGQSLADLARRGERSANCTHLHDLALFAAAHANDRVAVAYDIHVADPLAGMSRANLRASNGQQLQWVLQGDLITAPAELDGRTLLQLGDWIGSLYRPAAEAARILRWASMIARGRQMDIPADSGTERFPIGSCYTFSAEIAPAARRRPGAEVDFSRFKMAPLADRSESFAF